MPLLDTALADRTVCRLVTIGRVTGRRHDIEIWFAAVGDRVYFLSGGGGGAHWVRNLVADPLVSVRLGGRSFEGRARVVEGEADDPVAREAIAAKYGTTGLERWLRESLPVALDLEREVTGGQGVG